MPGENKRHFACPTSSSTWRKFSVYGSQGLRYLSKVQFNILRSICESQASLFRWYNVDSVDEKLWSKYAQVCMHVFRDLTTTYHHISCQMLWSLSLMLINPYIYIYTRLFQFQNWILASILISRIWLKMSVSYIHFTKLARIHISKICHSKPLLCTMW